MDFFYISVTLSICTDFDMVRSMSLLGNETMVILGEEKKAKKLRQYGVSNGRELCVVDVGDNAEDSREINLTSKVCLAVSYWYDFGCSER